MYAADLYLRIKMAILDGQIEREDPNVGTKVEAQVAKHGKLLFTPGLVTAFENEDLLTKDHQNLVREINLLLFVASLYVVLIVIWGHGSACYRFLNFNSL